jgi:predicted ATP-dependent endonuclease of OLD family
MIHDFKITGFRHFRDVKLTQLKRVNLFVGKNSSGKSALLEALILFFSEMSPRYLPLIQAARHENWDVGEEDSPSPLRHLFFNHTFPEIGAPGIGLASTNDARSFELKTKNYKVEVDGQATIYTPITEDLFIDADYLEPCLVIERQGYQKRLSRLDKPDQLRRSIGYLHNRGNSQVFFVPTRGMGDRELGSLWDMVSLTDAEADVITGLKLIEPDVEGIAFVGSPSRDRTALVRLRNHSVPVPLKSLGDGMSRILQIIVSLVNAKNNTLIIDEFENGLHWSVQEEVWALIFRLSQLLNVQVFATTHSRDCVEGFEKAWAVDPSIGSFARVQKKDNEASVREYTFGLLKDSIDMDVEVR